MLKFGKLKAEILKDEAKRGGGEGAEEDAEGDFMER